MDFLFFKIISTLVGTSPGFGCAELPSGPYGHTKNSRFWPFIQRPKVHCDQRGPNENTDKVVAIIRLTN